MKGGLIANEAGVFCGGEVARRCFQLVDSACRVELEHADGEEINTGVLLGTVKGSGSCILAAERVALNFLQRLSGIATLTRRFAERARPHGIRITDTRKTTPGLRILEKYAVRVGGGFNHRMSLDQCVMLKDNHFALAGGDPGEVVREVKTRAGHAMKVIAEAGSPAMVEPLVSAGADVVLLDNFSPEEVKEAVKVINGRCLTEVSGGVREDNLESYLIPGIDVISIGALTHSYRSLDISLEVLDAPGM